MVLKVNQKILLSSWSVEFFPATLTSERNFSQVKGRRVFFLFSLKKKKKTFKGTCVNI